MNRVIDHIDRHLGEELRLEALASVAAFSPYHFHRLFRAWTGETLQDFVRHRRLEKAGGQLVHNPAVAIQHIGQLCGFTSAEAFSRAFAQHFGMSPSAWRAGGYKDWDPVRGAPNEPVPRQLGVQVQHQAALSVAYVRVHGDYAQTPDEAWGQLLPWMAAHGLDTALRLGMALDDPTITAPARCRYDACVVLPADFSAPGERVARKTIAAGRLRQLELAGAAQRGRRCLAQHAGGLAAAERMHPGGRAFCGALRGRAGPAHRPGEPGSVHADGVSRARDDRMKMAARVRGHSCMTFGQAVSSSAGGSRQTPDHSWSRLAPTAPRICTCAE
jgi:AraC family transcriptional regulator